MPLINLSKTSTAPNSTDTIIDHAPQGPMMDANAPKGIEKLFAAPSDSTCRHFVTDGSWSLYDLLLYLVQGHVIQELYITTYSMTELSARIIGKMVMDGQIRRVTFLMDYKSQMRYPNVHQILQNIGTVAVTKLHAKVMVMQYQATGGGAPVHMTLIGSANWTRNPRVEVGVMDFSPAIAAAHLQWITSKIPHDTDTGTKG